MERNGPIDVEKLVATPAPAPGPARPDFRRTVIFVLIGVIVLAVALQRNHQRQAAQVEATRVKAEQEQAVARLSPGRLAARLQEVQACNSEPRIGEPEAILVAYAECFGARIQETRVLGRDPVRVYVVTGAGSWTVEGGIVTGSRR